MTKLCFVVSSPMTIETLLSRQIAALGRTNSVVVAANVTDSGVLQRSGVDAPLVFAPIERKIAPIRDLCALLRLVRVFRQHRFDVVHSVTPKAGLLAMGAAWLAGIPVRIHTFTGQVWATKKGPARAFLRNMDRLIARLATHVLVDSRSQREFLIANDVVGASKSEVLASGSISGVDVERFRPDPTARSRVRERMGVRQDAVLFLYVGRLSRDKGLLDLAAAFAAIAEQDARAELALIGPDEDGLGSLFAELTRRCANRVHRAEYTDAPEEYMAAADVFCLPSYREGFGQVAIEASATELPVIASRIYGVTDAVIDRETGLLHPPGDVDALTEQMRTLLDDPELRTLMGRAGRSRVLREFSAERVTRALLDYYSVVTGKL